MVRSEKRADRVVYFLAAPELTLRKLLMEPGLLEPGKDGRATVTR